MKNSIVEIFIKKKTKNKNYGAVKIKKKFKTNPDGNFEE